MLQRLSITNYALIDSLEIEFGKNFNIITGETGAGKSIIMGALGLLLGQRLEGKPVLRENKKCVIEGHFENQGIEINNYLTAQDIDTGDWCIIRREVTSEGRSRAFVNDTPVTLAILKNVTEKLIDIHAQHATRQLADTSFQLQVLDILAGNVPTLTAYRTDYENYKKLEKELAQLKKQAEDAAGKLDYEQFLYSELEQANLRKGETEELEEEVKQLENTDVIQQSLYGTALALTEGEVNAVALLKDAQQRLAQAASYTLESGQLAERLNSVIIEVKDIGAEAAMAADATMGDPARLQEATERLGVLYALLQKHRAGNVNELIDLKNSLAENLEQVSGFDARIGTLEKQLATQYKGLTEQAKQLHAAREKAASGAKGEIEDLLKQAAIPNGTVQFSLNPLPTPGPTGTTALQLLFSANKGQAPQPVGVVGSGGEQSRLMLALKTLTARQLGLGTIIFDEIDTGISGDAAGRVGNLLQQLAQYLQVICITHLPQIAAKNADHFIVYKREDGNNTTTHMRHLAPGERPLEIAEMLSGKNPPESAMQNALQLLNN